MSWLTNRKTRRRFPTGLEVSVLGDTRRPDAVQMLLDERTRLENLKFKVKFYDDILAINDRIDEINDLITIYTNGNRIDDFYRTKRFVVSTVDEGEVEIRAPDLAHAVEMAKLQWGDGGFLEVTEVATEV